MSEKAQLKTKLYSQQQSVISDLRDRLAHHTD